MSRRDIRGVKMGDGTSVWIQAGCDDEEPAPPARGRWAPWAGLGVACAALGIAVVALLA
jgi:hypothetical protein